MSKLTERQARLARFAKLTPHVPKSDNKSATALDNGLAKLGETLGKSKEFGRFRMEIAKGSKSKTMTYEMSSDGVKGQKSNKGDAELTVRVEEDDMWDILRGTVSPAEVYLRGRMLVVGDCDMARRIYEKIGTRGVTDVR